MAELLVCLVDKTSDDVRRNAQLIKRHDVVVIQPDEAYWGAGDRELGEVVKVPGVEPQELVEFVAEEDADDTPKILQRRGYAFDLDAYRASPLYGQGLTLQQALAFKVSKPSIPDPDVL